MHLLPRSIQAVATLNCLAALSACGGGDDATPEQRSAVDAYVGTWAVCVKSRDPGRAWREQYTLKKLSATTGEFEARIFDFTNEECRGDPQGWNGSRETIEWTGETQVVDGLTTDKVIIKSGTSSSNLAPTEVPTTPVTTEYQVMAVVNGQQLRVGTFTASNLQTYPEHLWSEILQRQ